MALAIYPCSADPITFGHIDIITRAARKYSHVIVAIGKNPEKIYLFPLPERLAMARAAVAHLPTVTVTGFSGLLADFAFEQGASAIIKGIRNEEDREYEQHLHNLGESQVPGIPTVLLAARPALREISSSAAKALVREQGFVQRLVPLQVKQRLEARILGQHIIGITGEIGAGKTAASTQLAAACKARKIPVHTIDLDAVGHYILGNSPEPGYIATRKRIAAEFGRRFMREDSSIDRHQLGEHVFAHLSRITALNRIMRTPLLVKLRQEMRGKKGIIAIDAALLVELGLQAICNNTVILVSADPSTIEQRLKARGLSPAQIIARQKSQLNHIQKAALLRTSIAEARFGRVWEIDTSTARRSGSRKLFEDIIDKVYKGKP